MRQLFKLFILPFFLMYSCDFSERDVIDPRLPRYSELGSNTAGCIINEKVWFGPCYFGFFEAWTSCDGLLVTVDTIQDFTEFKFRGGHYSEGFEELESVDILIRLKSKKISNFYELQALIGSEWKIDGENVVADLQNDGESLILCETGFQNQTGNIFFRSNGANHKAFAGTFGFSDRSACGSNDVFYGRFDYEIAKVVFSVR